MDGDNILDDLLVDKEDEKVDEEVDEENDEEVDEENDEEEDDEEEDEEEEDDQEMNVAACVQSFNDSQCSETSMVSAVTKTTTGGDTFVSGRTMDSVYRSQNGTMHKKQNNPRKILTKTEKQTKHRNEFIKKFFCFTFKNSISGTFNF